MMIYQKRIYPGLILAINAKINELSQNPSEEVKNRINKIKIEMIGRTDFIYDPEIWRMLDSQRTKQKTNLPISQNESTKVTALAPVKEGKKKLQLPNIGIFSAKSRKKLKVGCESMYIRSTVQIGDQVIKVKDLSKINLEWLAAHVSEKMLEESEHLRLEKEGRTLERSKYYRPDKKIPIFDYLESEVPQIKGFVFINEDGLELRVREFSYGDIEDGQKPYLKIEALDGTYITDEKIEFYSCPIREMEELIQYASFIDKVIGGDLERQLKNEIGVFLEKAVKSNNQLKLRRVPKNIKRSNKFFLG